MTASRGHVILTPNEELPYKVVLEYDGGTDTEQPVASMREGEALIKQQTPTPPARDKSRDEPALLPKERGEA